MTEVPPTDERYKAAEFIETYTGRAFYPLSPKPEAISIIDIAHGLSLQCRYGGQISEFYSVAQHSVLLTYYAEQKLKATVADCLQILMHDAPEAYMTDIPRPVKQYMPEYRAWDHNIDECIREWLGISSLKRPAFQAEIDSRIIIDERAQLKSNSGLDWGHRFEPLGIKIMPWSPKEAEKQFLVRYAAYTAHIFNQPTYMCDEWQRNLHADYTDGVHEDIVNLIEVDLRGGVGRVKLVDERGMLVRDPEAGKFPRPAWRWVHGKFTLQEAA